MIKGNGRALQRRVLTVTGMLLALCVLLFSVGITITYMNQDRLVQEAIARLNEDFQGRLEIGGSHISPFRQFPYISIDLENIRIYEGKSDTSELLMQTKDAYLGFDFWQLVQGNFEIRQVIFENGFLKLVQHTDGSFNLTNAFNTPADTTEVSGELHLDLQRIQLENIDLLKYNEESRVLAEAYIEDASSRFRTTTDSMEIFLETRFLFNLITDGDTSFLHDKHLELHTHLTYSHNDNLLNISESEVMIEKALFVMAGTVDVDDDMNLDLTFKGDKPNFDLLLAFAPPELDPLFARYDNGGKIYFDARVSGRSVNGHTPYVEVDFGCAEAFVQNTEAGKGVQDLFFKGHFTNGEERNPATMSLTIEDFSARPETGMFEGKVLVNNFESPEIDMQVICEFDLDFLAEFLNLQNLRDVTGSISLEMNFHDIVDLSQPEKSIEKLNESYFTALRVSNLNFNSSSFSVPVRDVNIRATMDGHRAQIDQFDFRVGDSDVSMTADVSDFPAILHHTDLPVEAHLNIRSSLLDLNELMALNVDSAGAGEQIRDLSMKMTLKSSARAFTESPNLPIGEFLIEELNAQFVKYPHRLHDFRADVLIDSTDFRIIDFTGMIDSSDFHFTGMLGHYDLWLQPVPVGITTLEFNLNSSLLQLEDVFSYGGENYVPEDYRHEEFRDLRLHGLASLEFDRSLKRTDLMIDRLAATMKVHPMRFEEFSGRFLIDSLSLEIQDMKGRLGNSDFEANAFYHFHPVDSQQHQVSVRSERLDFDQLFAYTPPPPDKIMTPEDHEAGFNVFALPFSNMHFDWQIGTLNYHRILLQDFWLKGRMQTDHFVYLDTLSLSTAGGQIAMNGYFNGSDPKAIYFSPNAHIDNVDLDKLLFKFENFGQDHLVSENLHGRLSGSINGNIRLHADLVPIIDESELHMDMTVLNGSLHNYDVFDAMSSYFADKNLDYVRFDTLRNALDWKDGKLMIPNMNINSSLGYFEVAGQQDQNLEMEYYVRIPLKVITRAGMQKLFAKKDQDTSGQIDSIQYRDETRRTRFLNLKVEGTPDEYRISLGKDKPE